MAELKDLFTAIGYEGDDLEGAVQHLHSNYIRKDKAHLDDQVIKQLEGKTLNVVRNKVGKLADAFGVEGGEKIEETIENVIKGYEGKIQGFKKEIQTIKDKSKEGQAKQVLDLQNELEDYKKSLQDYQNQNKELLNTKEQLEADFQSKIKDYKIQTQYKDLRSKIPFAEKADIDYFDWKVRNEYHLDLSDTDHLVIKDKDGHFIKSKEKAGDFASPEEVLKLKADSIGYLKKNDAQPGRQIITASNGQAKRQPKQRLS